MTRGAMDICLRVLKESKKGRFDSCSVRNSILIISYITFRDCRVHIFPTTFLEKAVYTSALRVLVYISTPLFPSPSENSCILSFRIVACKFFSDNLSRNSCTSWLHQLGKDDTYEAHYNTRFLKKC